MTNELHYWIAVYQADPVHDMLGMKIIDALRQQLAEAEAARARLKEQLHVYQYPEQFAQFADKEAEEAEEDRRTTPGQQPGQLEALTTALSALKKEMHQLSVSFYKKDGRALRRPAQG